MIISRKVIAQWLDINKIKDQELAFALNGLGFEVEKVKNLMFSNTNLIVGCITKITKHPKSLKLNICEVDIGTTVLTIVCGAANVVTGIKVVVAQLGSKLGNGLRIETRTIQGVTSAGMICSLSELGVPSNVQSKTELQGIIHLPNNAVVGNINPLQYLSLNDTLFFIDLTVNRSDCLGAYSIARELGAYFKIPLQNMNVSDVTKLPSKKQVNVTSQEIKALATLKINLKQNSSLETPPWMRRTLQLANIMPKTLAEDIANLVMLELGQPLLVFNGDILQEPMLTTSPKSYPEGVLKIETDDILLHDKYLVFAVLGINYNTTYEVQSTTKNIYLFSINPQVEAMTKQAKKHGALPNLLLERLTKPIVPAYYIIALQRYLYLLATLKIDYEVIGFSNDVAYQNENKIITLNFNFINKILGTNFDINQIVNFLVVIGCKVEYDKTNNQLLRVTIPTHRNDLNNSNDLSEEVGRIVGYDNLPITKPQFAISLPPLTKKEQLLTVWKQYLLSYGFSQVKTYSLTSKEDLKKFNFFDYKKPITLLTPLSSTREVMRFNLTHSLLKICQYNFSYKEKQMKLFTDEVIYHGEDKDHHLAFMVMGNFWPKNSFNKNDTNAYYYMKGFLESFLIKWLPDLDIKISYQPSKSSLLHPYLSTNIVYEEEHIATFGALHPQTEKEMDLEKIFLVEVNCTKLLSSIESASKKVVTKFKPWPKFNALTRDISIFINNNLQFADIKKAILLADIPFLSEVSLIDFYTDEKLAVQAQYGITLQLKFINSAEQLDEKKIIEPMTAVQGILKENFHAIIR